VFFRLVLVKIKFAINPYVVSGYTLTLPTPRSILLDKIRRVAEKGNQAEISALCVLLSLCGRVPRAYYDHYFGVLKEAHTSFEGAKRSLIEEGVVV
jgi:hypothetical protein